MKKRILVLCTLTCFLLSYVNCSAQEKQFNGDELRAQNDEYLEQNQVISSKNGNYRMIFQQDGNLCVYKFSQGGSDCWKFLWCSNTSGKNAKRLRMQPDGNLVIYDSKQNFIWGTMTNGHPRAVLKMQDDGNLVMYDNNNPIWASNTNQ